MAVIDIVAMKAALVPGGRLFGLDIGSRTIGIAVSDSALKVASPLTVLPRVKFAADMAKLKDLIAERSVGGLVLGLPIGLDGREGPRSQSVRQFAANLLAVIDLPLAFWDERFSTLGAERPMKEAEMSHRRRGELIDKLAAAYILQGALDRIAASDPPA